MWAVFSVGKTAYLSEPFRGLVRRYGSMEGPGRSAVRFCA